MGRDSPAEWHKTWPSSKRLKACGGEGISAVERLMGALWEQTLFLLVSTKETMSISVGRPSEMQGTVKSMCLRASFTFL